MIYFSCPKLKKIPTLTHGFFTRQGGVSKGLYSSLNVGIGSDDNPEHIFENRKFVRETLEADALLSLYQIHSNQVIVADEHTKRIEGDAIVTTTPNLAIGVLTADCVPVLFADHTHGVIGAAHAGWKGAINGITDNIIETMIAQGAKREHITATIGPCIKQKSYEVGAEFRENFIADDNTNKRFFKAAPKKSHYLFNISGYVKSRLETQNLATIHVVNHDTYKEEELFFSFRRATHKGEKDYGRQISAICLRG